MVCARQHRIGAGNIKQKIMSIKKEIKRKILESNKIQVADFEMYKMTASSFALCEQLDLGIITGKDQTHPQQEIIMFLFLHNIGAREARGLIFDESQGLDAKGRSKAFLEACMDWADTLSMQMYAELANATAVLLQDAFGNAIEASTAKKEGNAKKVA